jgi:hypothetical protein
MLTPIGERIHVARPDVDLDTHIEDVANTLVFEDLRDVILLSWSYGGVVITGVADRALICLCGMSDAERQLRCGLATSTFARLPT